MPLSCASTYADWQLLRYEPNLGKAIISQYVKLVHQKHYFVRPSAEWKEPQANIDHGAAQPIPMTVPAATFASA